MSRSLCCLLLCAVLSCEGRAQRTWVTTDELENHISPEDLREFRKAYNTSSSTARPDQEYLAADIEWVSSRPVGGAVDCFGLGSFTRQLPWLLNMKPASSDAINTHFFFYSRQQPFRAQVLLGEQFGLDWVDFKPGRKTVMIVHGFMSHSNASWVNDMARAFLLWGDVNVITVDWSGGGNTWKYWRAVANTRRVGSDVLLLLRKLIAETGARVKDFHFVGHSLGAHICSFVSYHLGKVARITGLDPAQPCFRTSDNSERLDDSDADFVDIIHTNGRLLKKIGFGLPEPAELQQAICDHGRAYLLFTESLVNKNCSFKAYRWNLSYEGVNDSLTAVCDRAGSCAEMGIRSIGGPALPRAKGPYFVLTTEKAPYCPSESQRSPAQHLLKDLRDGFRLGGAGPAGTTRVPDYADPEAPEARDEPSTTRRTWLSGWWKG